MGVSPGRDHSSVACWKVDSIAEAIKRSRRHCHGDIIRRLVARTSPARFVHLLRPLAAPFTSVHTHGMCHVLEALTDNVERATILSVDGMGSFDLISRESMMRRLLEVEGGGKVLPFVRQFYGFFFNTSVGKRRGKPCTSPQQPSGWERLGAEGQRQWCGGRTGRFPRVNNESWSLALLWVTGTSSRASWRRCPPSIRVCCEKTQPTSEIFNPLVAVVLRRVTSELHTSESAPGCTLVCSSL